MVLLLALLGQRWSLGVGRWLTLLPVVGRLLTLRWGSSLCLLLLRGALLLLLLRSWLRWWLPRPRALWIAGLALGALLALRPRALLRRL